MARLAKTFGAIALLTVIGVLVLGAATGSASHQSTKFFFGYNRGGGGAVPFTPCTEIPTGGCYESSPKLIYCMPKTVTRSDNTQGTAVNLALFQPDWDLTYKGAVPANFYLGIGATCDKPPGNWVDTHLKVDGTGMNYGPFELEAIYELFVPA